MPTTSQRETDPQRSLLNAVRESQAAVIDLMFDVAEQTLAAQRQVARTLAGAATRQADIAVETVDTAVEAADTTVEAVESTVRELAQQVEDEAPTQDRRPDGRTYEERSVEELRERAGALQIEGRSTMTKDELIAALRDHRKSRSARSQPSTQDRTPDRRAYEERSIEELRERARELEIEGRSTMTKDELIAALRQQAR